jgi:hypothetical protein
LLVLIMSIKLKFVNLICFSDSINFLNRLPNSMRKVWLRVVPAESVGTKSNDIRKNVTNYSVTNWLSLVGYEKMTGSWIFQVKFMLMDQKLHPSGQFYLIIHKIHPSEVNDPQKSITSCLFLNQNNQRINLSIQISSTASLINVTKASSEICMKMFVKCRI